MSEVFIELNSDCCAQILSYVMDNTQFYTTLPYKTISKSFYIGYWNIKKSYINDVISSSFKVMLLTDILPPNWFCLYDENKVINFKWVGACRVLNNKRSVEKSIYSSDFIIRYNGVLAYLTPLIRDPSYNHFEDSIFLTLKNMLCD